MADKRWAVLLCKFSDIPIDNSQKIFFAKFFAAGEGGGVDYWRDISFGNLNLQDSAVFGWINLPVTLSAAVGILNKNNANRPKIATICLDAARANNIQFEQFDATLIFVNGPIDLWGTRNQIFIDTGALDHTFISHEMGHGHGFLDSRAIGNPPGSGYGNSTTLYLDPFCIMSAKIFGNTDPTFSGFNLTPSGPGVCAPNLHKMGWLSPGRVKEVQTNGAWPQRTVATLSSLHEQIPTHPQVALLVFSQPRECRLFIEFRSLSDWDRGLTQDSLVIHHVLDDEMSYYAGCITTSTAFSGPPLSGGNVVLPGGNPYVDPIFDLSIKVLDTSTNDHTITIQIALRAAVQTLSLRTIAREELGINTSFSIEKSIPHNSSSLRERLVDLISH